VEVLSAASSSVLVSEVLAVEATESGAFLSCDRLKSWVRILLPSSTTSLSHCTMNLSRPTDRWIVPGTFQSFILRQTRLPACKGVRFTIAVVPAVVVAWFPWFHTVKELGHFLLKN